MTIDWQNATFEYIDVKEELEEPEEQKFSSHKSFQQLQKNFQNYPVKRSRNEIEEVPIKLEEVKLEDIIIQDDEDILSDNEDVKFPQINPEIMVKNLKGDSVYVCITCSIDFPTIAYLKRHQATKKHLRAMEMEERGRKICQRKAYMRKFKPEALTGQGIAGPADLRPTPQEKETIDISDLTPEEIELLHKFDEQLLKFNTENTTKEFYENFNFDLDMQILEPASKVRKLSSPEEILEEIISYEPIFEGPQIIPKIEPEESKLVIQSVQNGPQVLHSFLFDGQSKPKIQCQLCPKSFKLKCHYTQHINSVHSDKKFKCEICGKRFIGQDSLSLHLMRHSGDKPFKCIKCAKSYCNKIDLKRHAKSHDGILDYICELCGKGYIRSDQLQKHLEAHVRNGIDFKPSVKFEN